MNEYDAYAGFYDLLYGDDRHDLPFYLDLARETGGPVCELACGTGRLLLPLARAGFDVTGVDVCQAMLDRFQAKLAKEPGTEGSPRPGQPQARGHARVPERRSLPAGVLRVQLLPPSQDHRRAA